MFFEVVGYFEVGSYVLADVSVVENDVRDRDYFSTCKAMVWFRFSHEVSI